MNTGKENAKSIGTVRERERESYTLVKGRVALFNSLTHTLYVYQMNKEENRTDNKIRDGDTVPI